MIFSYGNAKWIFSKCKIKDIVWGTYRGQKELDAKTDNGASFNDVNADFSAAPVVVRDNLLLQGVLEKLCGESQPLNGVNISTILHRAVKKKITLNATVLHYLSSALNFGGIQLGAQMVGNALYGLQNLEGSAEVRGLVAALTPKVCASSTMNAKGIGIGAVVYGKREKHKVPFGAFRDMVFEKNKITEREKRKRVIVSIPEK